MYVVNPFVTAAFLLSTLVACTPIEKIIRGSLGSTGGAYTQRIELHSGSELYEVFVPVNGNFYHLTGSSAQLRCVNSFQNGLCVSCDIDVDHIQLSSNGVCNITITEENGIPHDLTVADIEYLAIGTPGRIAKISCFPSSSEKRDSSMAIVCPDTNGSNVTLFSGSSTYFLSVHADKLLYSIVGSSEQLGCIGPLGSRYAQCVPCDFPVQQIQVSEPSGICVFKFIGFEQSVYRSYLSNESASWSPAQILDVQCGLTHTDIPPLTAEASNFPTRK